MLRRALGDECLLLLLLDSDQTQRVAVLCYEERPPVGTPMHVIVALELTRYPSRSMKGTISLLAETALRVASPSRCSNSGFGGHRLIPGESITDDAFEAPAKKTCLP